MIKNPFKPQLRCCNFYGLCSNNQTLQYVQPLACAQISFGCSHRRRLFGQTEMEGSAMRTRSCRHCRIAHLELQGLRPSLVEIRRKMVEMKLLGYCLSLLHYFPVIKEKTTQTSQLGIQKKSKYRPFLFFGPCKDPKRKKKKNPRP